MVLLRSYELDLVHTVVVNTLIQKAPQGYPTQQIETTFAAARRKVEGEDRKQAYLEELFALSQRLEKIQRLSESELEEILRSLEAKTSLENTPP